ncbi:class I SAM-dependent methyltransferase [Saccharopolyspora mangrovi]|uniref:S-adenosyl-L-methionine-dependent methyltransferase n=1 Tax=Saccharopolyspora mangrovi TaxID=3082379 RepID=A0ABU6AID9_9PSEU|nr:class I SAM-dependent methyltransferase [Saccharopolyspora sp. S2-29]MEB3371237.1 class I SAM-dependent methyltransferase [Saccharopolyspora sp. S2-29]
MTTGQQWDIVTSVGLTALGVAAARALETHRDDRLISDPYAAAFVKAADAPAPMPTSPQEVAQLPADSIWAQAKMEDYMGVRSRCFDDFFTDAGEAGIRQVVILASGLDARAHRLDWAAGTTVFEIDQPQVLEFKQTVLDGLAASPKCGHRPVPIDLREDWSSALLRAGFDTAAPTAWLAEGLLPYLPPEAEQQLLSSIDELSAPGSRLAVEDFADVSSLFEDDDLADFGQEWGLDMRDLLHSDDRPEAPDVLRGFGWKTEVEGAEDKAARYGRDLAGMFGKMTDASRFVEARKPE